MKPVEQNIFGGARGNCMQAAIASLLELPLEAVPNFMEQRSRWDEYVDEYLAQHGLYLLAFDYSEKWKPRGYHLIVGKSPRGDYHHCVVAKDGEPVHDPYPGGNCELRTKEFYEVLVARLNGVGK